MNDVEIIGFGIDSKYTSNNTELAKPEFYVEVLKEESFDAIHGGNIVPFIYPVGKLRDIAGSDIIKIYGDEMYNTIMSTEDKMIISTIAKCEGYDDKECLIFIFKPLGYIFRNSIIRGWVVYKDEDPELLKKVEYMWANKICESRPLFMRKEDI